MMSETKEQMEGYEADVSGVFLANSHDRHATIKEIGSVLRAS